MLGLIDNVEEDLSARLSAWVSENTGKRDRPNATVREAANFINDTLLKEFIEQKVEGVHRISEETARRWLKRLGFHYKKGSTGVYCDKHEAPENQDARRAFIAKIDKINAENNEAALHNDAVKQKIEDIDREIMEKEELAKGAHQTMHQLAVEVTTGEGDAAIAALREERCRLLASLRPLSILIYSDESIFHSNANIRAGWRKPGETAPIQPKSEGSAIMVLLFMTDEGVLKLTADDHAAAQQRNGDVKADSTYTLEIGKNRDGYMDSMRYLGAVKDAIAVCKEKYPMQKPVLVVDQSSVHLRYATSARRAGDLNLHDETPEHHEERQQDGEGDDDEMRDGWFIRNGKRIPQKFTFDDGRRKGLETILKERGISLPEGVKRWYRDAAQERIGQEPDFLEEVSELEHLMHGLGGELIITPKFHPEFNPVELAWAICKRYTRRTCGYSITKLRKTIPEAMTHLTPEITLLLFDHVAAYREGYKTESNGATVKMNVRAQHRARQQARKAMPLQATFRGADRALWFDAMAVLAEEEVAEDAAGNIGEVAPVASAGSQTPESPPPRFEIPYQKSNTHRAVSLFREFRETIAEAQQKASAKAPTLQGDSASESTLGTSVAAGRTRRSGTQERAAAAHDEWT